jgi:hypothetical protein
VIVLGKKVRYQVKAKEKKAEIEKKKEVTLEDKFYWVRSMSGIVFALLGRVVFNLVGWPMFFWMIAFWFGWPWLISFVIFRIPYEKGKWDWKMIMKTGIGAYFFLFMLTSTIAHTIMVMPLYAEIFANPA